MFKIITVLICFLYLLTNRMFAADAPVTSAGNVINAIPGTSAVVIPVTATAFNNIGKFTLTLKFDTTRIRFVSSITNSLLPGMTVTYSSPVGNTQGKLVLNWEGTANLSLVDGSALSNLTFSYNSGTGIISWAYSNDNICQYWRFVGGILTGLNDSPEFLFYKNGGISNRGAPITYAPTIAVPLSGTLSIPVTVNDFITIGAITLYMEYDPSVISYQGSFAKNPAFGSSFLVGNVPGNNGKMMIIIQWFGTVLTLPNGSVLCTLNFTYSSQNSLGCGLNWYDIGPTCEYADATTVLIDQPTPDFYHNGFVAPAVVADFISDNLTPLKNEIVQLNDLSTGGVTWWNWMFDRPGVVFLDGTTAASQNPKVMFTDGGLYTITLTAGNAYFSDTIIKPGYIRAGLHGLWTGLTSSDWGISSNWDDILIPDSATNVVIPSSAANWPVFDGNLILGIHCNTLTLSGPTSLMTITGNLTIP